MLNSIMLISFEAIPLDGSVNAKVGPDTDADADANTVTKSHSQVVNWAWIMIRAGVMDATETGSAGTTGV